MSDAHDVYMGFRRVPNAGKSVQQGCGCQVGELPAVLVRCGNVPDNASSFPSAAVAPSGSKM